MRGKKNLTPADASAPQKKKMENEKLEKMRVVKNKTQIKNTPAVFRSFFVQYPPNYHYRFSPASAPSSG